MTTTINPAPSEQPPFDWAAFAPERIAYFSDLHLESSSFELDPALNADMIVLCGDIYTKARAAAWAKKLQKPCVLILGNHDFYGSSPGHGLLKSKKEAEGSLVKVLQDEVLELANLRIVGSTLWTDYKLLGNAPKSMTLAEARLHDPYAPGMSDHVKIRTDTYRKIRASDLAALHSKSRVFLEKTLASPTHKPTLVLSHHAPSIHSLHDQADSLDLSELDPFDACYASHLDELFNPACVQLWIHGHIHQARAYERKGVLIKCNPKGYGAELVAGFNSLATFSVADLAKRCQHYQSLISPSDSEDENKDKTPGLTPLTPPVAASLSKPRL